MKKQFNLSLGLTLRYFCVSAGLLLCIASAQAEESPNQLRENPAVTSSPPLVQPEEDPPLSVFSFLTKIPGDYKAAAGTIFSKNSIAPFAIVVGSTAVLMKYDYELWKPFSVEHAKKRAFFNQTEFGWNMGKGSAQFALAGGFLLLGAVAGNHRALRTASQIGEVVLVTGITTQVLKHITGRQSPSVAITERTGKWQWFTNPKKYSHRVSAYDAFPSGHIATTFATARVIELNYPEQKWIPYVSYPALAFISVSMVATNGHWWSDYPLSLFLAFHLAKAVTRGNSPPKEESISSFEISPYAPFAGASGIQLSKQF